ncbi:hypothetical protein [Rubellimicrobium arenae]|uniref:hypothetical protein n=1 Tax=Rubellimicrobium arenae TaxID=2817372 RepID=UPI001B315AA1|nr:hypothetical protein [Rubellimicrobium arenae]
MALDDDIIRFGTSEPGAPRRDVALGPMQFRLEGGTLRRLSWRGTEVVRGLSAPLRDESWGTWSEENASEEIEEGPDRLRLTRRFTAAGGALAGLLEIEAEAAGLVRASLTLTGVRDMMVNRAGFCLLHPVEGVAGRPLRVTHSDGRPEDTAFPEPISPAQPVFDIMALAHRVGPVDVAIEFEGEVFEMEDQRNWTDASYKTYCRPLSRPKPYRIAEGETVTQRITIRLGDAAPQDASAVPVSEMQVRMPDVLLAAEAGWMAPDLPFPARGLLLRLRAGQEEDATLEEAARTLARGGLLDLEVVLPEGTEPGAAMDALALRLARAGLFPRHVIALPEAFLKSYQPDAEWPGGPSPEACAEAVSHAFPEARVGLGMLTNFTELNRRPGVDSVGHYVTHGTSAIVHAADDASVLETLEALPQVFADARRIAGARGLRLGLVSIGMRSNPYGAGLSPNPNGTRRTMTSQDPRQKGLLAAAYAVAACAAAAQAGAEAVALAAPVGPFGILGSQGEARPIFHALAALNGVAERVVRVDPVAGLRGVAWESGAILANAGLSPVTAPAPFPVGTILSPATAEAARDPGWLAGAAGPLPESLMLGPCEVLFAGDAAQSL